MLESWQAAEGYEGRHAGQEATTLMIATTLGWLRPRSGRSGVTTNTTAEACAKASELIKRKHFDKDAFRGLVVKDAQHLAGQVLSRIKQTEAIAAKKGVSADEKRRATQHVAAAGRKTADQIRSGKVLSKDVRAQVDINTWSQATKAKKRNKLLFEQFGRNVASAISKMLNGDMTSERLDQVIDVVDRVNEKEDARVVASIRLELAYLNERAGDYVKEFDSAVRGQTSGKVIRLEQKLLEREAANA
jgi:hypothetical protein